MVLEVSIKIIERFLAAYTRVVNFYYAPTKQFRSKCRVRGASKPGLFALKFRTFFQNFASADSQVHYLLVIMPIAAIIARKISVKLCF